MFEYLRNLSIGVRLPVGTFLDTYSYFYKPPYYLIVDIVSSWLRTKVSRLCACRLMERPCGYGP